MIKRLCDKCGKEIGNDEAFIKIIAPNDNEHNRECINYIKYVNKCDPECIDLCDDCLWKFHDWMKYPGANKVIYIKSEDDFPNGPLTKEEEAEQAIPKTLYDLELPARVNNRLDWYLNKDREKRIPITDIGVEEVLKLTEEELFAIPGIGPKSIADVIHKLEKYGWKLREEENKPVDVSNLSWDYGKEEK